MDRGGAVLLGPLGGTKMDRHRIDPTHALTPLIYSCPACRHRARMRIVWPFWHCPNCSARLVPADLYAGKVPPEVQPTGGLDARPPSSSESTELTVRPD